MSGWHADALCKGNTELFYDACWQEVTEKGPRKKSSPVRPAIASARDICWRCPVRKDCFAEVMGYEEGNTFKNRFGIWAGLTPAQRRHIEVTTGYRCPKCMRIFDPRDLMAGKKKCGCGVRLTEPIQDVGDRQFRQLRKPKEVPGGTTVNESPSSACA